MALDPLDPALSKLERNIERDRSDVRYLARTILFDLKIDIRPSPALSGHPAREDLTMQLWIEAIKEDRAL